MSEVTEVKLPGVGIRYEFQTEGGNVVGVVTHRSGRRELYVATPEDKDEFRLVLGLGAEDARTLAELLGVSRVAEHLAELQQRIEGLAIDCSRFGRTHLMPAGPSAMRASAPAPEFLWWRWFVRTRRFLPLDRIRSCRPATFW